MTGGWWLPIGDYPAQIIALAKDGGQYHWLCSHA